MSSSQFRRGKRRFDDDEPAFLKRDRHRRRLPPAGFGSETFGLPDGDRWSTWDQSAPAERGPQPHPDWLRRAGRVYRLSVGQRLGCRFMAWHGRHFA